MAQLWAKSVETVRLRALPFFLVQQGCLRVGVSRCKLAAVVGGGVRCFVGVNLSSVNRQNQTQAAGSLRARCTTTNSVDRQNQTHAATHTSAVSAFPEDDVGRPTQFASKTGVGTTGLSICSNDSHLFVHSGAGSNVLNSLVEETNTGFYSSLACFVITLPMSMYVSMPCTNGIVAVLIHTCCFTAAQASFGGLGCCYCRVCVCVGVGGVVLCRCVCVCDLLICSHLFVHSGAGWGSRAPTASSSARRPSAPPGVREGAPRATEK